MTTEKIYHVEFKKNFECLPNVIIKKGEKRFYAEDKIDSILKLFASKMNVQKIIVPFENNIMKISKHNKIDLDTLKTYPDYIQFKKLIDSNEFFQKLNYLAARWMDEYEYEDKKEYKKEIEKLLPENVYIQKFSATCKKFFVSIAVKIEGCERYQEFLFS